MYELITLFFVVLLFIRNFHLKEFDPIFLEQHNFTACMSCAYMQHQYEQLKQTACMGCSDMLQGV